MISMDGFPMGKAELRIENRTVIVQGRLCRVAHVDGEGYKFLADPKSGIASLRDSDARADLFTFFPELPETRRDIRTPLNWTILRSCQFLRLINGG